MGYRCQPVSRAELRSIARKLRKILGIEDILASDNLGAANDFYNRIAYGGKEKVYNENMRITTMSDGTIITM